MINNSFNVMCHGVDHDIFNDPTNELTYNIRIDTWVVRFTYSVQTEWNLSEPVDLDRWEDKYHTYHDAVADMRDHENRRNALLSRLKVALGTKSDYVHVFHTSCEFFTIIAYSEEE